MDKGVVPSHPTGTFQVAPLPLGLVPRRFGFAKDNDDDDDDDDGRRRGEDTITSTKLVAAELCTRDMTRNSRLALPANFTSSSTKFKQK